MNCFKLLRALTGTSILYLAMTSLSMAGPTSLTINAAADTDWGWDANQSGNATGVFRAGGTFTLGDNHAKIYTDPETRSDSPQVTGKYAKNCYKKIADVSVKLGPSSAKAGGNVTCTSVDKDTKYVNYRVRFKSEAETAFFGGDEAEALSTFSDPQYIDSAGLFDFSISLGAGSSVYTNGGTATAKYSGMGPGLSSPLFDILLENTGKGLIADVVFASNPKLRFYDSGGATLTASGLESLLEGSGLGTESGLSSRLDLFRFEYDLSGAILPEDASFAAEGENFAYVPVPEPSSLSLLGLGLLGLLGLRDVERKE